MEQMHWGLAYPLWACAGLGQYAHYLLGVRCTSRDTEGRYILLQGLHKQVNLVLASNMLMISIVFILEVLET